VPDTMRAAVLTRPGCFELLHVPRPEPDAGQVRVRVEGCGVCGSNEAVWAGQPWFRYPLGAGAPGHEGWGVIDRLGPAVRGVSVGDRVAFLSDHALAEYDVVAPSVLVPLPARLDQVPFPGEAIGCAFNIFARSEIQRGETVAVVGVGFLGALLVKLAKRAGAVVIAVARRPYALELARHMGADHLVPMNGRAQVVEEVLRLNAGALCERTLEVTGKQEPLTLAAELTAERGRLVIAGYHQDGPRQVDMQLWNWRGLDVVNAHERDPKRYLEGMRRAVAAVEEGWLDPTPLYRRFALDQINDAFTALQERPVGFVKALVIP
jgi:threonine dehydrogenase-like Zn-dependent dehydrogenase